MTDEIDFDNWDDSDLDFDPFSGQANSVDDDRSVATAATEGFLEGVKERSTDTGFIKDVIRDALPSGYDTLFNTGDTLSKEIKTVYDSSVSALRPAMNEFRRNAKKHLPKIERYLPESVSKKLDALLTVKKDESGFSLQRDFREDSIDLELNRIFRGQLELDDRRRREDALDGILGEERNDARHRATMGQVEQTNRALQRLVRYQDDIASAYHRKHLDLTFRQYFVLTDLLKTSQAGYGDLRDGINRIVKNTALPEYLKQRNSEEFVRLSRDRVLGTLNDGVTKRLDPLTERLSKNAKQSFASFTESLGMWLDQLNDASAQADMMDGMGDIVPGGENDNVRLGASVAGDIATDFVKDKLINPLKNFVGRSETINKGGQSLKYLFENQNDLLNEFGRGEVKRGGILGLGEQLLRDLVGTSGGETGVDVKNNLRDQAIESVGFDTMSRRSLVEIIPGYLSRLLHQMTIFTTGNKDAEREVFDVESESFTTLSEAAQNAKDAIITDRDSERVERRLDVFIERFSQGELSDEASEELRGRVYDMARQGEFFNVDTIADDRNLSDAAREEVAEVMRSRFGQTSVMGTDEYGFDMERLSKVERTDDVTELSKLFRDVRATEPEFQRTVQSMVAAGSKDVLREAGLLQQQRFDGTISDQFNSEVIRDKILSRGRSSMDSVSDQTEGVFSNQAASVLAPDLGAPAPLDLSGLDLGLNLTNVEQLLSRGNELLEGMGDTVTTVSEVEFPEPIDYSEILGNSFAVQQEILAELRNLEGGGPSGETGGISDDGDGTPSPAGPSTSPEPRTPAPRTTGTSLLKQAGGLLSTGVKKGAKAYGSYIGFLGRTASKATGLTTSLSAKTAKAGFNQLARKTKGDILVGGSKHPVLTLRGFQQGEYFDAITGEVLNSMADVKGGIKDAAGNLVLRAEDYAKGLHYVDGSRVATKMAKLAIQKPFEFYKGYYGFLGRSVAKTFRAGKALLGKARHLLFGSKDVYVKGEEHPVLLKMVLDRGGYYSRSSRKVIRSIQDIDGEVVDENGNIVLSIDQIKRGLTDVRGRAIDKLNFRGMLGRGTATGVKGMFSAAMIAKGGYMGMLGAGLGAAKNVVTGVRDFFTGRGGNGFSGNAKVKEMTVNARSVVVNGEQLASAIGEVMDRPEPAGITATMGEKLSEARSYLEDKVERVGDSLGQVKHRVGNFISEREEGKPSLKETIKEKVSEGRDSLLSEPIATKASSLLNRGKQRLNVVKDRVKESIQQPEVAMAGVSAPLSVGGGFFSKVLSDGAKTTKDALVSARESFSESSESIRSTVDDLHRGEMKFDTTSITTPLTKMVDLMTERLPEPKKAVLGDLDGDGIRDGSYLETDEVTPESKSTDMDLLLEKLGGLGSGQTEEASGGLFGSLKDSILGKGKGLVDNLLGKGKSKLGGLLKGAGGKLGGLATAAGGLAATGGKALLGMAGKALPFLGKAAMNLGRIALGPVGLAATAAYGAYKVGEYFGERSDAEPLESLRYAQYGIDQENGDHLQAIRRLEDHVYDEVTYDEKGNANVELDYDDLVDDYAEEFGYDSNSYEEFNQFLHWFNRTFRPTLLAHAAAANRADDSVDLLDIDDEMDEEQKAAFTKVAYESTKKAAEVGVYPVFAGESPKADTESTYKSLAGELGIELTEPKSEVGKTTTTDVSAKEVVTEAVTAPIKEINAPQRINENGLVVTAPEGLSALDEVPLDKLTSFNPTGPLVPPTLDPLEDSVDLTRSSVPITDTIDTESIDDEVMQAVMESKRSKERVVASQKVAMERENVVQTAQERSILSRSLEQQTLSALRLTHIDEVLTAFVASQAEREENREKSFFGGDDKEGAMRGNSLMERLRAAGQAANAAKSGAAPVSMKATPSHRLKE